MRLYDIFKLSLNHVRKSKLRSWLTIIGIIIGVAAVVAIVSIGEGMQQTVTMRMSTLGADIITITPGYTRAIGGAFGQPGQPISTANLTEKDVKTVKSIPGVLFVNGIVSGRVKVKYLDQEVSISIRGVDPAVWRFMSTAELESGRFLDPGDNGVAVIGYRVAKEFFKQPITINRLITINGQGFRVVGILKQTGGFGGEDSAIFIPIVNARNIIEDIAPDQVTSISVKVASTDEVDSIVKAIEERLMISRRVTERTKDFTVTSAKQLLQQINEIMQSITIFLGGIAAVSLLVGGVGIANTMFMSVLERTREIGILKAMGATNGEVLLVFLIESALFGIVGGVIGIIAGVAISSIISTIGLRMIGPGGAATTVITPILVVFAICFSIFLGAISGLIPARQAAKLKPVDALRYER
jgi:putative ABC transport system permease protein